MIFFRKKNKKIINPLVEKKTTRRLRSGNGKAENIFNFLVILIFFGVVVYVIFFSSLLSITTIQVQGTDKIEQADVKKETELIISGKYLGFIPKNNLSLIGLKEISRVLSEKFKLIKNLEIRKKFPDRLVIVITEKKPMLILQTDGQEYVVDEQGVIRSKSDFESDFLRENKLVILKDISDKKVSENTQNIDPEFIQFILEAREALLRDSDIEGGRIVKTPSLVSGDILIETSETWGIYMSQEVGVNKEMEMLKAVLNGKIEKNKRQDLEYIDLRTDNKVYYKFKGGKVPGK